MLRLSAQQHVFVDNDTNSIHNKESILYFSFPAPEDHPQILALFPNQLDGHCSTPSTEHDGSEDLNVATPSTPNLSTTPDLPNTSPLSQTSYHVQQHSTPIHDSPHPDVPVSVSLNSTLPNNLFDSLASSSSLSLQSWSDLDQFLPYATGADVNLLAYTSLSPEQHVPLLNLTNPSCNTYYPSPCAQ